MAVPYDIPIMGYGNNVVNSLRIWDAQPVNTFNLSEFDKGDYQKAVEQENLAKTIVEVLYPNVTIIPEKSSLKSAVFLYFCQCSACHQKVQGKT